MSLNRREFLKIMGFTTAAVAFPSVLIQGCKRALEKAAERTNIIWIQAQSCSGCSVSLLNTFKPRAAQLITEHISLNYHQTLCGGTGHTAIQVLENAVKTNRKDFVLIVEGSIPTKSDKFCTIGEMDGRHISSREWIERLGANAIALVAAGTCSAYGGIPAAKIPATGMNPTGATDLQKMFPDKKVINIPGCPPHPDWMIGTLLHVLLKGVPELDEYNRPLMYFGQTVHDKCSKLPDYRRGRYAKHWGEEGCLYLLGCLGMDSCCDIPKRMWVDGVNGCVDSGSGCIGCTEPPFPDYGKRGLYQHLVASNSDLEKLNPEVAQAVLKLKNGGVING